MNRAKDVKGFKKPKVNFEKKYKVLKKRFIKKNEENSKLIIELDNTENKFKKENTNLKDKIYRYKRFSYAMIIAFFLFSAINFFVYNRFSGSKANSQNEQIMALANKIEIYDESPVLMKITNLEKLKSNKAFDDVEVGDTVLIYNNAKTMMVYSNKVQKITSIKNIDFEL